MRTTALFSIITILAIVGCTTANTPVTPSQPTHPVSASVQKQPHSLWGLWQITADPIANTLTAIPLRTGNMHVNALVLLEPPAGLRLKISNLVFIDKICDVDVTLIHPYPGLSQYIGFDVAGILISKGTLAGFHDPDLIMPAPGDVRLLNADGYSRWWNPVEFSDPGAPIFRYKDGLLGNKNSTAHFDCTLNGYKLFTDELDKTADVLTLDPTSRIPFTDGSSNSRHYKIDFTSGLVFNYAVDASWQLPSGTPPFSPDQYAPAANKPEAWAVSVSELENTLFNDNATSGGKLSLQIDVFDHYNAGLNTVWVDSPGNFDPVTAAIPSGGGSGFSTYIINIATATPAPDSIDILIGVECEETGYAGLLPDKPVTSYFVHTSKVSASSQNGPHALMHATTATDINLCDSVSFDASDSTGDSPLTFEWDFNGDGVYDGPEDTYTGSSIAPTHQFTSLGTFNVTVKVSNLSGSDISDPVAVNVTLTSDGIYVDGDYTGGGSDGTSDKPYTAIQDAMAVVGSGGKIHVDFMDAGTKIYDTAGLTLKSNIQLLGDNWQKCDQPKPRVSSTTSGVIFFGQDISNVTIEGFELITPTGPSFSNFTGNPSLCCINFKDTNANGGGGSTNDNTVRHCLFTGDVNKPAGYMGVYLEGAVGTLIEFCEFKDIQGVGSSNFDILDCVFSYRSDSTTIRKNWIHDLTADAASNSGRIEIFHLLWGDDVVVTNNLVNALEGINGYCNLTVVYIDGQPVDAHSNNPIVANNTCDDLAGGGYGFNNVIELSNTQSVPAIAKPLLFNNIVSNTKGSPSSRAYEFVAADPADPCVANYCNAYNTEWLSASGAEGYLYITKGTGSFGNWTNPQDPSYISIPSNYDLTSSSPCQMGDPSIVDWDDTGSPSGDPTDPDTNTRSRMGAFGGPGGDWWPLE
jgi:hypothetical protein